MDENKKVSIWRVLFEAFLMATFASIISLLFGYILKSDILVNVTSPFRVEGQFISAIDIKNLSSTKSETSLQMFVIDDTRIQDIQADTNGVTLENNNTLKFENIAPNSSICILITSNTPITKANFRVSSDSRVTTSFLADQKNFSIIILEAIGLNFIILLATYGITTYVSERRWNKRLKERTEFEKSRQIITDNLNADLDRANRELEKAKQVQQETQLFYVARFSDFSKELSFWKDTIRKLLYSCGESKENADELYDTITNNLKTYLTKKVYRQDYDTINYLARRIASKGKDKSEEE